ncbi:MAG: gluconate 2-dehydrogenase subunit 3 family protein [Bryobacterales bacterium]|nr:gluconate 2-dehydrogenase subunit 3 family protein [Bryobacterales bacterium]
MKRRTLFPILGAGLASAQTPYLPRFFDETQYRALHALADTLLPDDGSVPGAVQVRVPWFIDTTLHYTASAPRQTWLDGLKTMDEEAMKDHGKPFADLSEEKRIAVMERLSRNEKMPQSAGERFFVFARRQVVEAWALSAEGQRRGLGYTGNVAIAEFKAGS